MVKYDIINGKLNIRIESASIDEVVYQMNRHINRAARYSDTVNFIGPERDGNGYTAIGIMEHL